MSSPLYEKHPELAQVAIKYLSRAYQGPIDDTMVWDTLESFNAYANMRATYAYPGQIVSILNKSDDSTNNNTDAQLYVLRNDGTVQPLSDGHVFDSMDAAMGWLVANAGHSAKPGVICTIKYALKNGNSTYGLFAVNETTDGFVRVSFNQEDIPTVTWESIVGNPFSEDADKKLKYTDSAGASHRVAYESDLNRPEVLDEPPANPEPGYAFYQKL